MKAPNVFISYSHDSAPHKDWVAQLGSDLRARGVDVILDQWDLSPGQDTVTFMERSISTSDRVILICSDAYIQKSDEGRSGVGYERLIVSAEVAGNIDTKKFIPLVRNATGERKMPRFLGNKVYLDFCNDSEYMGRLNELVSEVHGLRANAKPPLGPSPFSAATPNLVDPMRTTSPSGLLSSGRPLLSDEWFLSRSSEARDGLRKMNLNGSMELRLALHDSVRKSQLELLASVRNAEVHTFGWPIGITLENRNEYKPKPFSDGVRAEIALKDKGPSGEPSYDFWAARNTGDFYALQSFFEDQRTNNAIFFNTRIVRITEGLMFACRLYSNLGLPPEARVSVAYSHFGLANRILGSSSPNRIVIPRKCTEDQSDGEIIASLENLSTNMVDHVIKIAEPMFMLFDFASFDRSIYEQIVTAYQAGKVT